MRTHRLKKVKSKQKRTGRVTRKTARKTRKTKKSKKIRKTRKHVKSVRSSIKRRKRAIGGADTESFKYIVEVENAGMDGKIEIYTVNFFKWNGSEALTDVAPGFMDVKSLGAVVLNAETQLKDKYEKTVTTKRYNDFATLRTNLLNMNITEIPFPSKRFANRDRDKRMAGRSEMLTTWLNNVISKIGGVPPELEQFFNSGLGGKASTEEADTEEANTEEAGTEEDNPMLVTSW